MSIKWIVVVASFLYLVILFVIATWAEKNKHIKWLTGPYVYALSLAVYCTAWTYYGSVGRAANNGIDFLTTYVGPVLMAPLLFVVLRKIIRICKAQRITTLSDFISARYGKNLQLGALVSLICFLAIIPYMSIQLKAISSSFDTIIQEPNLTTKYFFYDTAFYISIVLAIFTILFGAMNVDANRGNIGLMSVIAFESLFKLFAFLLIGIYVTYGLFNGFGDIFQKTTQLADFSNLITIDKTGNGYSNWFFLNILSMCAFILLPRQFHVGVKENRNEDHLRKAMWLFPLYLLCINIFVIPVALSGNILFAANPVDADTYVLAIPLSEGKNLLAVIVYLGGFAAATSMIIISASALSIMIVNNVITPIILENKWLNQHLSMHLSQIVLRGRQLMIILLLLAAYLYFKYIGEKFSLVSIGLISFVGVAQFAPAAIGGLYWKEANAKAASSAIIVGTLIWFLVLVLPTMIKAGLIDSRLFSQGIFGLEWFETQSQITLEEGDFIAKGFMWSITANIICYLMLSVSFKKSIQETNQAEVFVDIFKYSTVYESAILWKGSANVADVKNLLSSFIGKERTDRAIQNFSQRNAIETDQSRADFRVINFAEKLLSGAVGSASARVLMRSIAKEDEVRMDEIFSMLKETQKYISDNKELKQKSAELEEASKKIIKANDALKKADIMKDEFISTVTHEMRTPLTAIRAMSEILSDHDELEDDEKSNFLKTIVAETKRMDRLINQVLDLEKLQTGKLKLPMKLLMLNDVVNKSVESIEQLAKEKTIKLEKNLDYNLPPIQGNFDRLTQVALNLLSNALKFADPEKGKVTIETSFCEGQEEYACMSIIDNGPGIDPASIDLIFQAFYQAENQTLKKPEGTGLGLTISRSIVEAHGGTISIENINKGTKINVKLPIEKVYE